MVYNSSDLSYGIALTQLLNGSPHETTKGLNSHHIDFVVCLLAAKDQQCLQMVSENSAQPGRITWMIRILAGRTCHIVCITMHCIK